MKLFKDFNITPNNKKLYVEAFTHQSFINEKKIKGRDYQRLE
jgi:dsRNA-specific ribonuclease